MRHLTARSRIVAPAASRRRRVCGAARCPRAISPATTATTTAVGVLRIRPRHRVACPISAAPTIRGTRSRSGLAAGCTIRRHRRSAAGPAGAPAPRSPDGTPRNRGDDGRTRHARTSRGCPPGRRPERGRHRPFRSPRHRCAEDLRPHHVPPDDSWCRPVHWDPLMWPRPSPRMMIPPASQSTPPTRRHRNCVRPLGGSSGNLGRIIPVPAREMVQPATQCWVTDKKDPRRLSKDQNLPDALVRYTSHVPEVSQILGTSGRRPPLRTLFDRWMSILWIDCPGAGPERRHPER
jgi:hypothetical protein